MRLVELVHAADADYPSTCWPEPSLNLVNSVLVALQFHEADGATLGLTALTKYTHVGTALNTGEHQAFVKCVEAFLLDSASRAEKTVKVNVAWDENDYQIDVGTEAGMASHCRRLHLLHPAPILVGIAVKGGERGEGTSAVNGCVSIEWH